MVVYAGVVGMVFSPSWAVSGRIMLSDLVRRELDEVTFRSTCFLLLSVESGV